MRVLLVESDSTASKSIELMLTHANLNVYCTDTDDDAVDLAKLYDYDLILLSGDDLPDMHGHNVLKRIRMEKVKTPVLVLSGRDEIEDKIKCFGFGADDYVTKPFHREELIARIHAIILRSKGHPQSLIQTGDISINLVSKEVSVKGNPLHLTSREYAVLELLSLRKGATITREMFLNTLYEGMDEPSIKNIDIFICKLRRKLAEAGLKAKNYVCGVRGRGYTLKDPDEPKVADRFALAADGGAQEGHPVATALQAFAIAAKFRPQVDAETVVKALLADLAREMGEKVRSYTADLKPMNAALKAFKDAMGTDFVDGDGLTALRARLSEQYPDIKLLEKNWPAEGSVPDARGTPPIAAATKPPHRALG